MNHRAHQFFLLLASESSELDRSRSSEFPWTTTNGRSSIFSFTDLSTRCCNIFGGKRWSESCGAYWLILVTSRDLWRARCTADAQVHHDKCAQRWRRFQFSLFTENKHLVHTKEPPERPLSADFCRLLHLRPLGLNLNSLGIAKTESMQLIMANESLFEQTRRGVH